MIIKRTNRGFEEFAKMLQGRAQSYSQIAGTHLSINSNAEYSGYVDQGTRYMPAQPFFQDTIDSHSPQEIGPDITLDKIRRYRDNIASEMKSKAPVDTGNLVNNIEVVG
jgi:hypothetical protein